MPIKGRHRTAALRNAATEPTSSYGHYIGRVGALAVALGIGAAIASTPGVAWADGTDGDTQPAQHDTASGAGTPDTPVARSSQHPDLGEVIHRTLQQTTDTVRKVVAGVVTSTGGAHTSTHSTGSPIPSGQDGTTGTSSTSASQSSPHQRISHSSQQPTTTSSATGTAAAAQPFPHPASRVVSPTLHAVQDGNTALRTATSQVTAALTPALHTSNTNQNAAGLTTAAVDVAPQAAAAPQPNPVVRVVSGLLAAIGITPGAANSPVAPVSGPTLLGALALIRRELEHTFDNQAPQLPTTTSLSTDNQHPALLTGLPTTDGDGDAISYSAPAEGQLGGPQHGTVTVDGNHVTYTPEAGYVGDDSFTLTASDANPANGLHIHGLTGLFNPTAAHTDTETVSVHVTSTQVDPPALPDPAHPYTEDALQQGDPVGTVRGHINARDPQNLPIAYGPTGPTTTADGSTLTVNPDGSFIYTPSDDARHAAAADDAASTGADTFTFTVTATNSRGASAPIHVTLDVAPTNAAIASGDPTVGRPAQGVVTGDLAVDDPDGDTFSYTLDTAPTRGMVAFDSTGHFVYVPTTASRGAASSTGGADSDTFTVNVSDGHGSTITRTVTVEVAPNGVVADVSEPGQGFTHLTTDGSHALLTTTSYDQGTDTSTTRLTVIDTTTGATMSDTAVTQAGQVDASTVDLTADGTRAIVTTRSGNTATGDGLTTHVVVVDTASGNQIGSAVTQTGSTGSTVDSDAYVGPQLFADDTRALLTTSTYDPATGSYDTYLSVLDVTTGSRIGDVITQPGLNSNLYGAPSSTVLLRDDTRVLLTSQDFDSVTGASAVEVTVFDTTTGAKLGDTVVLQGQAASFQSLGPVVSDDETRAIVITSPQYNSSTGYTSQVAIIDVVTGAQVGDTFTNVSFQEAPTVQASDDASRIVLTTQAVDPDSTSVVTTMRIIDTADAAQVGTAITQDGSGTAIYTSDGARILMVTSTGTFGSDGYTHYTTLETTVDTATGAPVGDTITLTGQPATVDSTPDGSRVILTTRSYDAAGYTTRMIVLDTATGAQRGNTLTQTGSGPVQLIANGTRAVLVTTDYGSTTTTTSVAVVDTASGDQLGDSITQSGEPVRLPNGDDAFQLIQNGTRAVLATNAYDSPSDTSTIHVTVFDPLTGTQVGSSTTPMAGHQPYLHVSPDGSLAAVVSYSQDPETHHDITHLALFDTATVTQIGTTTTAPGRGDVLALGTDRVVLSTGSYTDSAATVIIIDPADGSQVGTTFTQPGYYAGPVAEITDDGTRVIVKTVTDYYVNGTGSGPYQQTTHVSVIDTATGQQVGSTITQGGLIPVRYGPGTSYGPVLYNTDQTRAVIYTNAYDAVSETYASKVSVIDTATGEQIGDTLTQDGVISFDDVQWNADQTRLIITNHVYDPTTASYVGERVTLLEVAPSEGGDALGATRL